MSAAVVTIFFPFCKIRFLKLDCIEWLTLVTQEVKVRVEIRHQNAQGVAFGSYSPTPEGNLSAYHIPSTLLCCWDADKDGRFRENQGLYIAQCCISPQFSDRALCPGVMGWLLSGIDLPSPTQLSIPRREGIFWRGFIWRISYPHSECEPHSQGQGALSWPGSTSALQGGRASRQRLGAAFLLPGFPRHLFQQLALSLMINSLPENEAGVS